MGIIGSHKLLTYWLTDVTIKELFAIATMRCESSLNSGIKRSTKPTIDVDISWVYRRSACAGKDALENTFKICLELVKEGFHVELICDGSTRHHTKRATISRKVKRYKSQLSIFEKRAELMQIAECRRCTDSLKERESYEADEKTLSNSIKRMENQFQAESVDVGKRLYDDLNDAILLLSDDMIGSSGGSMSCCQAKYQADSVIAYRAVHGISDVVLMNDSDLAAHVGNHCLGIKDFKFIETATSTSLREIQLFSPSYDTIQKVAHEIGVNINKTKHRIHKPEYPVLENIHDIKLRCLIAVGLGCDVTASKNVKQVTARSLWLFLNSLGCEVKKEDMYDSVINFFIIKHFKLRCIPAMRTGQMISFVDMMEVYVEAYMYEPATYYTGEYNKQATPNHIYIHGTMPLSLHPYVKDFAENNRQILIRQDNITMIGDCVGAGDGPHCYLCDESSAKCITCTRDVCSLCIFKSNDLSYCVNCYVSEKHFSNVEDIENTIPIATMREKLESIGLDVGVSELASDIIDWYDALIIQSSNLVYANDIVDDCMMPTEDSLYINDMIVLNEFDAKEGGRFIRNDQIPVASKIQLLILLGDLVTITNTKSNNELSDTEKQCYAVIPKMLVHFAKNARIGSGYRLIKRCIRHGLDPRATSILHANIKVIAYNDEVGLFINHKIRASMKTDVYDVQVCFTRSVIVSCTCSCKAGCFGKGKVICVHVLPTIFQYTLLLFDGLSEHILCEVANDWTIAREKSLSMDERKNMMDSLCKLEQATGKVEYRGTNISIVDFLRKYQVGTESSKMEPPPPKDPSKLGPLRELDFRSPTAIAKNIINKCDNPIAEENIVEESIDLEHPNYSRIRSALSHLTSLLPNTDPSYSTEDYVGLRLLFLRENQNSEPLTASQDKQLFMSVKEALSLADATFRNGKNNREELVPETSALAECVAVSTNEDHSLMDLELLQPDKSNKKYHMGGCAMEGCYNIEAKLVRVPPVQKQKHFTDTTSINVIKTYFKKTFLRKEWLRRIHLNPKDERKDLRICSTHTLQQMSFAIPWKNIEGTWESFDTLLVVPMMDHESYSKTRTDKRQRVIYFKKSYNNTRTKFRTAVKNVPKVIRKCNFIKCTTHATLGDHSLSFRRVPPVPKLYECKRKMHTNCHRKREAIRKFFRSEFLRRIGMSPNSKQKDLRICSNHPMEILPRSVEWIDVNNNKCTEIVSFPVPAAFGRMSDFTLNDSIIRSPKGVGITRQTTNYMNNAMELSQQPGNDDLSWGIALVHSLQDEEDRLLPVNLNDPNTLNSRRPIYFSKTSNRRNEELEKTVVRLSEITDKDVRNETGYRTKQSLLSTIIILYNGDIKNMCNTISQLTWFEEWYFVFEKIWGKANKRYFDVVKKYKRSGVKLREIYDSKMKTILEARRCWPIYVTLNEDTVLRNDRWNKHYAGKRVVMWDNTNIRLYKASNAEAQRNTYSTYYAGNVGKGAVFVQLCGWMGTHELWCGAVSDSEYMIRSGVLEQQREYVPKFDPENAAIPFINILDKGYRIVSAAWRTGGQFVLQPAFAKSDRKFNSLDIIRSAAVASDRGGNERAVRISKLCGPLKDGLNGNERPDRLCDLWLAWPFLTNFMFKPVL